MPKFRVLSKVHSFHFKGKRYFPEEIVESSEEDAAQFNLDFLERIPESVPSVEVSVVDGATTVVMVEPEVRAEPPIVLPEVKSKVKSKVLPKVQP
jgi:hypothetical protein